MPDPRPVRSDDFFRFRLVSDPQIAPDGSRVVYVCQRVDRKANRYRSQLRLAGIRRERDRAFTAAGDQSDRMPRWSPDGTQVAFVRDRDDRTQLWCIPADGGEAEAVTELEEGSISSFAWHPSGRSVVLCYRPRPEWARKEAREAREREKRSTPPLVVRRLAYREEGVGYFGDERWHLYLLDLETRALRPLTQGETDNYSPCWSADGTRVAFLTNRSPEPDITNHLVEIRVVDVETGRETLLPTQVGPKSQLAWGPDGRFAWYGSDDTTDNWSATDPHLWTCGPDGSGATDHFRELDRSAGDSVLGDLQSFGGGFTGPLFAADGSVWCLVSDQGACHLYRLDPSGRLQNLTPGVKGEVGSLSLSGSGTGVACLVGDVTHPGEVWAGELSGEWLPLRQITRTNDEVLAEARLAEPEEAWIESEGGRVHAWLLRPRETPSGGAPLILFIHGGPHTQYGWAVLHEIQSLAGRGFAVLFTNPRGSRGYGQEWTRAIQGDWGGADYRDLMAAVDWAVRQPGIDPARLGVTGGSYGGYMTNWIVGQTDRFRCAVTQRSVVNLHSMAGTCDFNFSESEYFGGNVWDRPGELLRQSPLTHAGKVVTPILIMHAEGDLRCPIEQAEQWYGALRRRGCTVEFVRYPREANHGLTRSGPPDLRLDSMERIAAWFTRWLMPE